MSNEMPATPRSWTRPAVIGGAAVALVALAAWGCRGKGKEGDPRAGRAVPVTVSAVRTGDLDLTLTGIGTVVPLNVATVRSRVDGTLMRVHFQEGQMVRAGQLLAEIDPRPFQVQLMQAEGQLAKDQASLKNAKADFARFESLVGQGIISRQSADTQGTSVAQLEAAVQSDRAAVESAKLNLTYSRLTAPVAGRVGLRQVEPGNLVRASDTTGVAVVTPVSPISALFTVPADHIQEVLRATREGGRLPVEAFDRDQQQVLAKGSLQAIDNQVDLATGTVKLRAEFPNQDGALFPNQFVNIRLRVETLKGLRLIPTAAIQRSPQGTFVYVVKADSTVELRPVEIRATDGDTTALAKGVEAGETIATDGLDKLKPGSKVLLPDAGKGPKGEPKKGRS